MDYCLYLIQRKIVWCLVIDNWALGIRAQEWFDWTDWPSKNSFPELNSQLPGAKKPLLNQLYEVLCLEYSDM